MGKGLSIGGFVAALLGLVLSFLGTWFSIIALPLSVAGLILSVIGGKKVKAAGESFGLATAGLVVGIIAVVISTIFFFTCGLCTICALAEAEKIANGIASL